MNKTRHLSYLAMLAAIAVVLNMFENFFIPPLQFGIRFGIANVVSLYALYTSGIKDMWIVVLERIIIGSLLRGIMFHASFWISATGVLFSAISLTLCYKLKTGIYFSSMISSISHSFGQVVAVMFLYREAKIMAILPILVLSSLLTGILTALLAGQTIKRVHR